MRYVSSHHREGNTTDFKYFEKTSVISIQFEWPQRPNTKSMNEVIELQILTYYKEKHFPFQIVHRCSNWGGGNRKGRREFWKQNRVHISLDTSHPEPVLPLSGSSAVCLIVRGTPYHQLSNTSKEVQLKQRWASYLTICDHIGVTLVLPKASAWKGLSIQTIFIAQIPTKYFSECFQASEKSSE